MGSSRHQNRKGYTEEVRLNLLEDDADRHEAEVASMKAAISKLTYSIIGGTVTLVTGLALIILTGASA